MARILMSGPDVTDLEREAVAEAFASGWIAPLGPAVDAFEAAMAERIGRSHAVALASGTSALHLGLLAWGVGPGDVVPTSTMPACRVVWFAPTSRSSAGRSAVRTSSGIRE